MDATTDTDVDVLIVGAGPSGLALGVDLARRGVRALIVERQEHLSPGGRGTGLQPRTQEVYDDLGILDAIHAVGGAYPPMAIWEDGRKTDVFEMVERVEPTPGTPHANALMVPQWRNQEALYARLLELGGRVAFDTALDSFTQDPDGVTARVVSPSDPGAGARTLRAAYLVGTDGGRSRVRKALGVSMSGPDLPAGEGLVADLRIEGLDRDHWHRFPIGTRGFVTLLPLARTDLFQCFAAFADTPQDASPDAVRKLIATHTHLTLDQIHEVVWTSVFRPRAGVVDRFRSGRVFLAGDAAHIHSPAGGQGLNTSVQDAYNLGWKLGQVLRYGAPDSLLETYDAERRPVAADILNTSTRLHRTGSLRRGRDLHQLTLGYRHSPLTLERRWDLPDTALRAGDRAPNSPCTTPSGAPFPLSDAFRGPHFTLLITDPTLTLPPLPTDLAALPDTALRTYRIGGPTPDLLDPTGHALDTYGTALFLIRPDGHLALASPSPTSLTPELRRYFPEPK